MQLAQRIARDDIAIGTRLFACEAEGFHIGHRIDRHNLFAADAVDEEIAGGGEDKWLRALGQRVSAASRSWA